jgi:hypothetical protein
MFALGCWEGCVGCWANTYAMFEAVFFRRSRIVLCAKNIHLFENSITFGIQIIFAFDHFGDGLACREKRAFFLEHDAFAMFFPIFRNKFERETVYEKFTLKFLVTFHTVGKSIGGVQYKRRMTLATGLETT